MGEEAEQPTVGSELVDQFSRIDVKGNSTISFNDISSYIMELGNDVRIDKNSFKYTESNHQDKTIHYNYIEKAHYIQSRDEILFYEQSMKTVRVYDPIAITKKHDYSVTGTILSIEFIDQYDHIAVSLSNRDLIFLETFDSRRLEQIGRASCRERVSSPV